jgi:hypothetical protein
MHVKQAKFLKFKELLQNKNGNANIFFPNELIEVCNSLAIETRKISTSVLRDYISSVNIIHRDVILCIL